MGFANGLTMVISWFNKAKAGDWDGFISIDYSLWLMLVESLFENTLRCRDLWVNNGLTMVNNGMIMG